MIPPALGYKCAHARSGKLQPVSTITHRGLEGSTSRASDELHTSTELCPLCSAIVIAVLKRLETGEPIRID